MNPKDYTVENFITDDAFVSWVLQPNAKTETQWREFLLQYPHQASNVAQARAFVQAMQFNSATSLDDATLIKMKSNIDLGILEQELDDTRAKEENIPTSTSFFRTILFKVAASFVIVALASVAWYLSSKDTVTAQFAGLQLPVNSEIITAAKGKRSVVTLEDGTRIWLNADSHIAYRTNFLKESTREVYLDGEAFFDVTEDKKKPFIVHTSALAIKVLGTAFNVKSFSADATIETTLVRGKVQIDTRTNDNDIILLPNQQAVYVKDSKQVILENQVVAQDYASWKSGKLYFKDETFRAITQELERWYDVKIHVENERSWECRFSAQIDNKSIEEVLELFKTSGPSLEYKVEGNEIFITGDFCEE